MIGDWSWIKKKIHIETRLLFTSVQIVCHQSDSRTWKTKEAFELLSTSFFKHPIKVNNLFTTVILCLEKSFHFLVSSFVMKITGYFSYFGIWYDWISIHCFQLSRNSFKCYFFIDQVLLFRNIKQKVLTTYQFFRDGW